MKNPLSIFVIIFLAGIHCNIFSQNIPKGFYIGYEPMHQMIDNFFPGVHLKKSSFHSKIYFHEVLIEVENDENSTIFKVPVDRRKNKISYLDSVGCFFRYDSAYIDYYGNDPKNVNSKYFLTGHLSLKKKCATRGSGVPLYADTRYDIVSFKNNQLTLETEYGQIVFNKLKPAQYKKAAFIKKRFTSIN